MGHQAWPEPVFFPIGCALSNVPQPHPLHSLSLAQFVSPNGTSWDPAANSQQEFPPAPRPPALTTHSNNSTKCPLPTFTFQGGRIWEGDHQGWDLHWDEGHGGHGVHPAAGTPQPCTHQGVLPAPHHPGAPRTGPGCTIGAAVTQQTKPGSSCELIKLLKIKPSSQELQTKETKTTRPAG